MLFFFCKQKTAYEMRISDWSSDVCSSDLPVEQPPLRVANLGQDAIEIGVGQPVPAVRIGDAQPRLVTGDRIGRDRHLAVAARDDLAVRIEDRHPQPRLDRKSTRLNSSH